jgi:hypothetical protein
MRQRACRRDPPATGGVTGDSRRITVAHSPQGRHRGRHDSRAPVGPPDAECSAIDHLIADAAVLRSGCLVSDGMPVLVSRRPCLSRSDPDPPSDAHPHRMFHLHPTRRRHRRPPERA